MNTVKNCHGASKGRIIKERECCPFFSAPISCLSTPIPELLIGSRERFFQKRYFAPQSEVSLDKGEHLTVSQICWIE